MDQIANMLITMKNASMVSKETVVVPFSKLKYAIAQCLKEQGFIVNASKKTEKNNVAVLEIELAYTAAGAKIHDVKRMSKQSRRMYTSAKEIGKVKNGYGITVLSTPKGILSDKQARKEMVGGEILFTMW
jgi:small subunit ribosomal protein S8